MRRYAKAAILAALAFVMMLSGCYSGTIDQYFSPPQPAEEYLQLQELIDRELAAGSEYAAPTQGSYRQSVQFADLDGDGMDEALVFLRRSDGSLQVKIYLSVNSEYRQVLVIGGEGRAIGSVDFEDMDLDGRLELIVAWQLTGSMSLLSVYSLDNWSGALLLNTDCSEYLTGDLNSDGHPELLVLRNVGSGSYMADMYTLRADRDPQAASAALSSDIYALQRLRTARLADGTPTLVVESLMSNGDLVTDLLSVREGSLVNLTLNRSTGISETRRSYSLVYAQDINADGLIEIPHPQQLYSQDGEVFWSVAWYSYDAFGRAGVTMTTYHNVTDGWYFELPVGWEAGLTVRRNDDVPGERAVILSRLSTDGSVNDLVAVYKITGENRGDRARLEGRFILLEETSAIYAAQIFDPGVEQAMVTANFHRIYTEWGE
ncbi:MAG: hypothetical protein IKQ10_02915 [Oscillospiraceae bacterium]|nr:hypothetical protein [Oscillospiraceae bacterium]